MNRPLRLGYLIPQFPGQTHIFFWRELQALQEKGVEPVLLSTRPPPQGLVSHEWSTDAAASTTYLAQPSPMSGLSGIARFPAQDYAALKGQPFSFARDMMLSMPAADRLVKTAKERGIDHVHVHSCGRAALIAAMAYRMGGPRYSLTLHGPLEDYGPGQHYKWRYAQFATIITRKLLDEVGSALADSLPSRVEVQAMGVDTNRLKRIDPWVPPAPDSQIRITSCGRLNRIKGHQDLLEAVALLRGQGHDVDLTIAGEDDDGGSGFRSVLQARITELGLDRAVTLLGAVSEAEVHRQLLSTHIFALASWHEPLGVALMEAMSCEVPTIGTAAGGVAELITHGEHGLLVPPRNPEALADAILRLVNDPDLARRLASAGRERVVSKFGAAAGAETLVRLIGESVSA
ncbi:exopolysaccharide biosynthesis GT4 family glycosyltransferase EpsE [Paracoccus aestuariivivens]|uniref:Glycosyltransferase n=1 Tax=Paracoccus aestuariivivens TaxID=1820333 RepID=A0A6L6JD23_9RHOB|nr:exopolysaccharide biosynthesis GT4 family glycosyltransferase EpsE [Paracoccus aestuariivivens]MTH80083.1 glycosyltransferase [Paracoccus aestuariivivens]